MSTQQIEPTIDVRRAEDRFTSDFGWLDSKHSFSFGHHYDPRQHPPRPAAGQQRRHRRPRHRLRDAPAPRHGDRHLGAAGVARPPGLHRPQRGHLPRPRAADERRHAASCTRRRTTPGASSGDEHRDPVHFVQMWVVPDEAGITPGYEQLEIDDELLERRPGPGRLRHGQARRRGGDPHQEQVRRAVRRPAAARPVRRAARGAVPAPVRAPRATSRWRAPGALATGDAVRFTATGGQKVTATEPAEILVWEMHATLAG